MKKILTYSLVAFVVGAVVSPLLGMNIGKTRNWILGLAPEQAVLELANKIDLSRGQNGENKSQIQELQTLIEQQKTTLEGQSLRLSEMETALNNASNNVQNNTPTVEEVKSISADVTFCQTNAEEYTAEKYNDYEEMPAETRDDCIDKDSSACDKAVSKAKNKFEEYKVEYEEYHKKCD